MATEILLSCFNAIFPTFQLRLNLWLIRFPNFSSKLNNNLAGTAKITQITKSIMKPTITNQSIIVFIKP